MANRMAGGNVIVVDSAMGNLGVFQGTDNLTSFHIGAFSFLAADTSAACVFTGANTADSVVRFNILAHAGSGGLISNPQTVTFAFPLRLNELKVPTLTAGTGWVYLV